MLKDAESTLEGLSGVPALRQQAYAHALEESLAFQSVDPREIPFNRLAEHVHAPTGEDTVVDKYRAGIHNRTSAIRAFCVYCQGGNISFVRQCSSLTCPLYPFRAGKDPFRGYALPVVNEPELDDDISDDIFTDSED